MGVEPCTIANADRPELSRIIRLLGGRMKIDPHDQQETYCRKLGHDVPFKYCRSVDGHLPCRLVPDCWYTQFDVAAWLQEHYTPEQIARVLAPPQPKLASILDLIAKAQAQKP